MSEDRQFYAPRHPTVDRRSLVLWTGYRSGLDVSRLQRDVIGAIAMPVKYAASDGATIASARAAGFGIVLPGQAWLNQLPPDERGGHYSQLAYCQPARIDLETQVMSASACSNYAESFLDAQVAAGATLVTTPAHVFESELAHGRNQDIALAEASIVAWRARQGWRPPAQRPDDPPRELHACIAVRGRHLANATDGLIQLYAALDVAGYWLVVFDCGDSGVQLGAAADLALGLQEITERPVTISGVASMHEAMLASGVAAACAGLHGMRPAFPPASIAVGDDTGIGIPVFHPAILGVIPLGAAFVTASTWLFATHPCRCGEHPAAEAPRGRTQTIRHNTWCLAEQTRDATRLAPVLDEARLISRIARADEIRAHLRMRRLPPGWSAVSAAARARRDDDQVAGLDA